MTPDPIRWREPHRSLWTKWLLLAAITILLFGAAARADYRDGLTALQRGDYALAHDEFHRLAQDGHAAAQYSLGFLYDYGEGVQQNHSEAAKWYRKAVEQGLARAQFSLGIMYESGTGVPRDLARSYKWYSVAAETLASGRTRDTVIESRDLIATQLSKKQRAAAQVLIASYWTDSAPESTDEIPGPSPAEGKTATTEQGVVEAPVDGAITSERARYESALAALQRRDYVTAYRRILPLANQGHAHAQYTVGFLYAFGRGVEQDPDAAIQWYRKAAEQGLPEAHIALGIMYESGASVARDLSEAHRRYSLAVEHLAPGKTRDTAIEQRDRVATLLSQEQLPVEPTNAAPTGITLSNNKVAETAPTGTHIGTVSARDPDADDSLVYALTEDAGGRFAIDPDTGALSVARGAELDFETAASFELAVTATDVGGLADGTTLTIILDDVNEAPGNLAMTGGRVSESAPIGTHVGTASASDPDAGDSLVYALTEDAGGRFAIDPASGALSVAGGADLDCETTASFKLALTATDNGGLTDSATVTVNLDDVNEAPRVQEQTLALEETAPAGTHIGAVSARDPDAGDSLVYALTEDAGGRFAIDPANGALSVAEGVNLDLETTARFELPVTVTDVDGLSDSATVTISLDDVNEAPSDLAMTGDRVAETAPAGTHIGTASARDPDAGDTLVYALTDDTLVYALTDDTGGRFAIDPASGALSVARGADLDFETAASFELAVTATDVGGLIDSATVTISLDDVNEAPGDLTMTGGRVAEAAPAETQIGTISARDPDAGDTLVYALTDDAGGRFAIDPASGALSVAEGADLDFEAGASFKLALTATDSGGLTDSATVTVNLDDVNEAPRVREQNLALEETAPAGTHVGTVSARDPDAGDSLVYAITEDADGRFVIDPDTGALSVAEGANLDFETAASFELPVTATDVGGLSDGATLTISLDDVNEAPGALAMTGGRVAEAAPAGTHVGTVSARDPDVGDSLVFDLTEDGGGRFVIDPDTGALSVAEGAELYFETAASFELVTNASGLSHEASVTVSLDDVNEAPGALTMTGGRVAEAAPAGTHVGTVSARDPDAGDSLVYSLSEDAGGRFAIDPDSGALSVAGGADLDFETAASFELTVTATDGGGLTDGGTVTVNVDDVNEAPGALTMTGGRVAETAPAGTHVGTVTARDPDDGDSLFYALTEDAGGRFAIDPDTGALSVVRGAELDFETAASILLAVTVTDIGGLTGGATVSINLDDVNEAPWVQGQTFALDETAPAGTLVGTVVATDPDGEGNGVLSYAITGGNRSGRLDAKNDPLARIDEVVPWEDFRPRLEAAWRKPTEERKSPAGRKPWDAVVMFKAIVLCELYNLSDDQVEYQLRDRLSFMRFLGLGLEDKVPDAKTVWLYREQLAQAGVIETLFEDFDGYLEQQGYLAMGGQIIDASIVPVPKQRNSGDDNARIKEGETPEGWENQPAKRSQKDTDARWTKKHGKSHYGYKNHVNVDRRHKLVRRYRVTDAAVHDSQIVDDILDPDNTASDVWADSAYRSAEIEAKLEEKGLKSRIHRKGYRNKPLSEREKRGNTTRSKVRARVEHVFGAQSNDMGGTLVRSIGMVRARARIGLKNLAYNMRRLVQLERLATAAPA